MNLLTFHIACKDTLFCQSLWRRITTYMKAWYNAKNKNIYWKCNQLLNVTSHWNLKLSRWDFDRQQNFFNVITDINNVKLDFTVKSLHFQQMSSCRIWRALICGKMILKLKQNVELRWKFHSHARPCYRWIPVRILVKDAMVLVLINSDFARIETAACITRMARSRWRIQFAEFVYGIIFVSDLVLSHELWSTSSTRWEIFI